MLTTQTHRPAAWQAWRRSDKGTLHSWPCRRSWHFLVILHSALVVVVRDCPIIASHIASYITRACCTWWALLQSHCTEPRIPNRLRLAMPVCPVLQACLVQLSHPVASGLDRPHSPLSDSSHPAWSIFGCLKPYFFLLVACTPFRHRRRHHFPPAGFGRMKR
ncbi:hypothetical protein EDB81DRAFT_347376 [Dactylonectria macrodidyma]|uniref:Uncharacterized protein n=1 Tax=Dactylonectria macrodidyma TaxID=307937 RepID=A0A9P9FI33_9HYPO|nr:hypothetical protein EDB81DRAFT_347376 [Dactylonectria macrodidyma]